MFEYKVMKFCVNARVKTAFAIFLLVVAPIFSSEIVAQTCSCAGAPLISSQNFATVAEGNVIVGLTWEHNNISSLYSGSDELQNRTQERYTNTSLLEINYGITKKFSLSSTFTFIEKSRTTGLQAPGGSNNTTTRGIGDGMMMLKYHPLNQDLWNPYQISIGGGLKIPFATTSLRANNVALNADMQPGTGAWDGIGWIFVSRAFRSINMNAFMNGSYRYSGTSERFNETDRYTFGNEFVAIAGLSGGIWDRWSYETQLKFRSTTNDQLNGFELPNTGGRWFNIKAGIGYQILDQVNVRFNGELPISQHLNGTQPTTTFIISGSVFFSLNKNQTGFIYGISE